MNKLSPSNRNIQQTCSSLHPSSVYVILPAIFHAPIMNVARVFLSSTWIDLQAEREAVERAVNRLRETKFVGMEYFRSRDETTARASLDEVDRSVVYVGVFGGRYGSGSHALAHVGSPPLQLGTVDIHPPLLLNVGSRHRARQSSRPDSQSA
jgi:hypothetical protein